jgi:hypothetical protein
VWQAGTPGGYIAGAFQVFGPGAVNVIDSTTGILFSAGGFPSPQQVNPGDVISVNYGLTI